MREGLHAACEPGHDGRMNRTLDTLRYRWRILAAALGGAAAGWAASHLRLPGSGLLIGWVAAAAIYVATTVWMFMTTDEADVRRQAAFEDENRGILTTVMLMAAAASLGVAIFALRDSKILASRHPLSGQWIVLALAGSTLILSWLIAQCLFVLHYAHRYFGDFDANGAIDGGINFPGEPPRTYRDFIYVAVCVGATCQVSDFNITTARFRGLVTTHALFSFAFNTMVLALGINILAGLLGQ
jgi:uncharacterized membrane protein